MYKCTHHSKQYPLDRLHGLEPYVEHTGRLTLNLHIRPSFLLPHFQYMYNPRTTSLSHYQLSQQACWTSCMFVFICGKSPSTLAVQQYMSEALSEDCSQQPGYASRPQALAVVQARRLVPAVVIPPNLVVVSQAHPAELMPTSADHVVTATSLVYSFLAHGTWLGVFFDILPKLG